MLKNIIVYCFAIKNEQKFFQQENAYIIYDYTMPWMQYNPFNHETISIADLESHPRYTVN